MQSETRTRWLGQALAAVLVLVVVAGSVLTGLLAPLDDAMRALRFEASNRAPSGDTVLLEIDAGSLAEMGVWPWPRKIHAELIDRLMAAGASEVVFDIDFSTASNAADDLALEQALERAGGYVLLAAFQQSDADGTAVLAQPLARFAQHSDAVLVNVDGDGTGLLRSLPLGLAAPPIPSVAVALAPEAVPKGPTLVIDYGIDLSAVRRISVADFLAGRVDNALVEGKQVIVGASAIELRDFFRVPRFGVIPGAMVQLAAVETLKAKRALNDAGSWPALLLLGLVAVGFAVMQQRLRLWQMVLAGAVAVVAAEAGAWLLQREAGLLVSTSAFALGMVLLVLAKLVLERAMRWREYLRQQARLAYLARHDVASGALTPQALLDELAPRLSRGEAVSLMLVRMERLDGTVASLGHDIGDRVAAEVVARLEHELQTKPARIGFEQFAWSVADGLTDAQQQALCLRVASRLDAPYTIDGHSIMLDSRFGSTAVSADGISAGEMLRQADVALHHASEAGLKLAAFEPAQGERIAERRRRDIALRQALERGEFYLLYQPQHDLANGRLVGVEALVRWRSEELGLVSPADFIPLSEETGLIVDLGAWILHEACMDAAKWDWNGTLAVNVSSQQFRLGDVVGDVRRALEASRLPASRLVLEITESLFIDDDAAVLEALGALKAMGVGVALDDFGTGYSSLSYLARLPVDKLKIDQSFVRGLPDAGLEALVETIVLMAKRLGKQVVAEGVETLAQRDYLARLGCDVGQGYLFAKPSTPEALGLANRQAGMTRLPAA